MRISFSIEIKRDSDTKPESEETVQPDMSGVHIEVSGQDVAREMDLAVRRVGFGQY